MSGHSGKSGSVNAHESPCIENAGATQFILRYLIPGQEKISLDIRIIFTIARLSA